MKDIVCQIMGISQASYYRWKDERPVINLLEKYCTEEDLQEYLLNGRISKFEINIRENEDLNEFFLKNALFKVEIYGKRQDASFFLSVKQALKLESIPECLPVKTFLNVLTDKTVSSLDSFLDVLDEQEFKYENWKNIIITFVTKKISKKEMDALIANKIYAKNYLSSLAHLNHG